MATNYTDLKGEIKAQIKPNGVGAITGQVLQDAMLSLVGATEAEMSALNAATDEKLAQLDQEWQEIKDADFTLNPHTELVEPSATTITLEPDKLYKWGGVSALNITLNAPKEGCVASYYFQFTCPADAATSLALPVDIVWAETPTIKAGMTYQVSIVNGLAIIKGWKLA